MAGTNSHNNTHFLSQNTLTITLSADNACLHFRGFGEFECRHRLTWVKWRKGWRISCDVGDVTERLANELCYYYNCELCSFSNVSVTSPMSQLILQPFRRFIYVTAHSPTVPLLHLRHSSFSNPSFASPMSQALHLIHLASRPWLVVCVNTQRV